MEMRGLPRISMRYIYSVVPNYLSSYFEVVGLDRQKISIRKAAKK